MHPILDRLSIDSMAHLLSILIHEPHSRLSRATKKHIAANYDVREAGFGTDKLGGLLGELPILDAGSIDDPVKVNCQPVHYIACSPSCVVRNTPSQTHWECANGSQGFDGAVELQDGTILPTRQLRV